MSRERGPGLAFRGWGQGEGTSNFSLFLSSFSKTLWLTLDTKLRGLWELVTSIVFNTIFNKSKSNFWPSPSTIKCQWRREALRSSVINIIFLGGGAPFKEKKKIIDNTVKYRTLGGDQTTEEPWNLRCFKPYDKGTLLSTKIPEYFLWILLIRPPLPILLSQLVYWTLHLSLRMPPLRVDLAIITPKSRAFLNVLILPSHISKASCFHAIHRSDKPASTI